MRQVLGAIAALLLATSAQAGGDHMGQTGDHNWAGWYAGLQVGYGRDGNAAFNETSLSTGVLNYVAPYSSDGLLLGFHSGYNFQRGRLVFGYESDFELTNVQGIFYNGNTASADYNYAGSLRGRIGLAHGNYLFYATGGLAYADIMTSLTIGGSNFAHTETTYGWTAGGGIEMALNPNLSARVEYRYTDYGDTSVSSTAYRYPHENEMQAVRLGLTYKLDAFFGAKK
ncbi:MAG: outer membrane protein [Hyphomicrobiaceae bacterium]